MSVLLSVTFTHSEESNRCVAIGGKMMLNIILIVSKLFDQMKQENKGETAAFLLNHVQLFPGLHRKQDPSLCQ